MISVGTFEQRLSEYISSGKLLHRQAPVIVALSGGADSVALLAALCALGYDCRAAHCNYHLRGQESMRDMNHCRNICEKLDIDLYIRDFDVEKYQNEHPGESVEMACRELRYKWFGDLLDRDAAQAVAVGHHREDRAETFMLNLMRGAGIVGLSSMNNRSGNVVRPLLDFSRGEIEDYLKQKGLTYITDSSNASDAHRRNRLRNKVFPLLEELFPGAMDSMLHSIGLLENAREIYSEAIATKRQLYFIDNKIDILSLKQKESEASTLLFEFLKPLNFTATQIENMLESSEGSGARFESTDKQIIAELNRGVLEIVEASKLGMLKGESYDIKLTHDLCSPIRLKISRHNIAEFRPESLGASVAYFDATILNATNNISLRHWLRGDRMTPFGKQKSKLVSDIYADAHFSASQKRQQWIMVCNDDIVWLPGLRNSAMFTIGPETKEYIRLYFEN